MTFPHSAEEMIQAMPDDGRFGSAQLNTLRERIEELVHYEAAVGLLGKSGVGKSSLCNALLNEDAAEVDDIAGCTVAPTEFTLAYRNGKGISLIDLPGVGKSSSQENACTQLYRELLPELDLVLWVLKADDHALSVDEQCFKSLILPQLLERDIPLLLVANQIDKIEPCREWNGACRLPGPQQLNNITRKQIQLSQRFMVPVTQIFVTSSATGYGLQILLEQIVHHLPKEKRKRSADPTAPRAMAAPQRECPAGPQHAIRRARTLFRAGWRRLRAKWAAGADGG